MSTVLRPWVQFPILEKTIKEQVWPRLKWKVSPVNLRNGGRWGGGAPVLRGQRPWP